MNSAGEEGDVCEADEVTSARTLFTWFCADEGTIGPVVVACDSEAAVAFSEASRHAYAAAFIVSFSDVSCATQMLSLPTQACTIFNTFRSIPIVDLVSENCLLVIAFTKAVFPDRPIPHTSTES